MRSILRDASIGAVVAFGVTVPMIVRDFDLAMGGVIGLSAGLAIHLMAQAGVDWRLAALAGIGISVAIGIANGIVVAYIGTTAIIATLGMGSVATGLEYFFTDRAQISFGIPAGFLDVASAKIWGLDLSIVVALAAGVLAYVLIERTEIGRRMRAVGGNREAARLSGVDVRRLRLLAFVLAGAAAGITGIVIASQGGAYTPDPGLSYLLPTYAAIFVGAAAFRGEINIIGTAIGLVFLSMIERGLLLSGLAAWLTNVIEGAVVVLAMVLSRLSRSRRG